MKLVHKLRYVFYTVGFLIVFLIGAYWTFPRDVLRDLAESSITNLALGLSPKNRGVPVVTTTHVSLWRLSGMSISGLKVGYMQQKNQLPLSFEFDELNARLSLFSLLTGQKKFIIKSDLYGGELDASFKIRQKNQLAFLNLAASKLDLQKMEFFEALLGAPLQGLINMKVAMDAKNELGKDGTGSIKLNWDNLSFGPGNVSLPAGGFVSTLTVPKVALGKLVVDMTLDKGQLDSKTFSLTGGDLEGEVKVSVSVGRQPSSSRLTGEGWFSLKREFINSNETLKMLYDLIPELKESQNTNGKVGVAIRGNVARPQFKLERYQEKPPAQAKK